MDLDFSRIKNSKNLLAFSGGVDSSALFFLLLNSKTNFDIAIVNYNIREQSKDEVEYALNLANKYDKKIFLKDVKLESSSNFEKNARDIRYNFFKEIIKENSYQTLITAHQLNDRLEWFLMQLSKGAGLLELFGMKEFEEKKDYSIFRPLLNISKDELEKYLKEHKIKYFIDSSNIDEKYKRNYFRHNFSDKFLNEFQDGIKNSFSFLENDLNSLNIKLNPIITLEELEVFENLKDNNLNLRVIDKSLKQRGFLLSQKERIEILKQKEITISHKINIAITKDYIFIAPKAEINLTKEFKEFCRIKKIPQNIRAYIFLKKLEINF
ncbi:tRNA lysidine(34) synthetase TilS [Aliarcobacter trophiarum LMG 25534]|uniref:tRNA(Ile)-lysidine synthase n=1 Tax=Aliarcobacter trophiarum LMG 25534 TaxID=1032241 RepID=A0AAD0QHP0_9BACT|nr:tRNA lysidine(34) synthetase TilS [Aliarcobacter trophiarum]AXK48058.1 tRNA(Ile)-lysidine synthetase [Aliarcobacter trophiarum LMG 25534]RXI27792.1 tRNA lysidine(34) synthetase TilS [Aliarcobacter trophiarum]RXJ93260.1 tRNA lysidine(34) synthetase TilS [Aliarcobacter trophiarum LMG 25534]